MMVRTFAAALAILLLGLMPTRAETPKELNWQNLIPAAAPLQHPFLHLSTNDRVELEMLYGIRQREKRGLIAMSDPDYARGRELTEKLTAAGLDVEPLLDEFADLMRQIELRSTAVVHDLNDQLVRLPGYALPLEFNGTAVDELLLVPFIGACIHVPAPPANQVVYVQLNQSYVAGNLFEPVWITGRMKVQQSSRSLTFVDGSANVEAAYRLEGIRIEPYTR